MAIKTIKGFQVVCPMCGDVEATVRLDLNDLKACSCTSCDAEFSPTEARDKVREQLDRWSAVVRWCELANQCLASDNP